jgi:hypothetical protein
MENGLLSTFWQAVSIFDRFIALRAQKKQYDYDLDNVLVTAFVMAFTYESCYFSDKIFSAIEAMRAKRKHSLLSEKLRPFSKDLEFHILNTIECVTTPTCYDFLELFFAQYQATEKFKQVAKCFGEICLLHGDYNRTLPSAWASGAIFLSMLIARVEEEYTDKLLPRSVFESSDFFQNIDTNAEISWSPIGKVTQKSYMVALEVAERIHRFIFDHPEFFQIFNQTFDHLFSDRPQNLHVKIDFAVTSTLNFPNEEALLGRFLSKELKELHSGQKVNDNPTTDSESAPRILYDDYTRSLPTNESSGASRSVDTSNGLEIISIIPKCKCGKYLRFRSESGTKCSNPNCRKSHTSWTSSYSFRCMSGTCAGYNLCLLCSIDVEAILKVDRVIRTVEGMSTLVGCSGKFQVIPKIL